MADPQEYWKIVEELNSLYSKTVDDTEYVLTEDWVNHFRGLMVKLLPNSLFTAEVNNFIASKDN